MNVRRLSYSFWFLRAVNLLEVPFSKSSLVEFSLGRGALAVALASGGAIFPSGFSYAGASYDGLTVICIIILSASHCRSTVCNFDSQSRKSLRVFEVGSSSNRSGVALYDKSSNWRNARVTMPPSSLGIVHCEPRGDRGIVSSCPLSLTILACVWSIRVSHQVYRVIRMSFFFDADEKFTFPHWLMLEKNERFNFSFGSDWVFLSQISSMISPLCSISALAQSMKFRLAGMKIFWFIVI